MDNVGSVNMQSYQKRCHELHFMKNEIINTSAFIICSHSCEEA